MHKQVKILVIARLAQINIHGVRSSNEIADATKEQGFYHDERKVMRR
jgi:hypothetical protein